MMILNRDVLGSWGEFGRVRHGYTRLIVLVNFAENFGLRKMKWEDAIDFFYEVHDWNCLSSCH